SLALQVRVMLVRPGHRGVAAVVVVLTTRMITLVPSQTSIAKGGVKIIGWPHSMVWFAAQVMLGGVVSTTVIVWLQMLLLPQLSVVLQVRVMVVRTRMITLVPSHPSTAKGGVKRMGWPHSIV